MSVSLTFVGATVINNNGVTSIAQPSGTNPGDLLVLVVGTGWLAGSMPVVSDPRIEFAQTSVTSFGPNPAGPRFLVGYGTATDSSDPIAVASHDGETNGRVILAAYRVTGGGAERSVTVHRTLHATSDPTPWAPSIPPGSTAAIIAGIASLGPTVDPVDSSGQWTRNVEGHGSAVKQAIYSLTGTDPLPLPTLPSSSDWIALTIGFIPTPPPPIPPPYDGDRALALVFDDSSLLAAVDDTPLETLVVDDLDRTASSPDVTVLIETRHPAVVEGGLSIDGGSPTDDSPSRLFSAGEIGDDYDRFIDGGAP